MICCHHCIPYPRYWLQVETLIAHRCVMQIAQCCITSILINGRSTRVYQWNQCTASKANNIRKSPQLTMVFCHCTHCKFISFECCFLSINLSSVTNKCESTYTKCLTSQNKQAIIFMNKQIKKLYHIYFYSYNSMYWTKTHSHTWRQQLHMTQEIFEQVMYIRTVPGL